MEQTSGMLRTSVSRQIFLFLAEDGEKSILSQVHMT
jgi:hypothetical protein